MITDVKEAIKEVLEDNLATEVAAESARLAFDPSLKDVAEIVLSERQTFPQYPVVRIYSQKTDRKNAKSAGTGNIRTELVNHVLNLDILVQADSPDSDRLEKECEAYLEAVRKAVYKHVLELTQGSNIRQVFFDSYIYSDIFKDETNPGREYFRKDVYADITVEEITQVLP